jgi:septal ring factor EnvC (AmiA/AmiB activator)
VKAYFFPFLNTQEDACHTIKEEIKDTPEHLKKKEKRIDTPHTEIRRHQHKANRRGTQTKAMTKFLRSLAPEAHHVIPSTITVLTTSSTGVTLLKMQRL